MESRTNVLFTVVLLPLPVTNNTIALHYIRHHVARSNYAAAATKHNKLTTLSVVVSLLCLFGRCRGIVRTSDVMTNVVECYCVVGDRERKKDNGEKEHFAAFHPVGVARALRGFDFRHVVVAHNLLSFCSEIHQNQPFIMGRRPARCYRYQKNKPYIKVSLL